MDVPDASVDTSPDTNMSDVGGDDTSDTADAPDSEDVDMASPLMAAEADGTLVAADLSCMGVHSAPSGDAAETISTPVVPFGAPPSVTIPGVPVFFHEGAPASPCEAPCVATTADGEGIASVELMGGAWYTTEVPAIDGPDAMRSFMRTLEQHWRAGHESTINTFNRGTLAAIEGALGASVDPTKGIVAGRALDCQGRRSSTPSCASAAATKSSTPTHSISMACCRRAQRLLRLGVRRTVDLQPSTSRPRRRGSRCGAKSTAKACVLLAKTSSSRRIHSRSSWWSR